jgi:anaerobic selenocysteine-containing dehydrogenase
MAGNVGVPGGGVSFYPRHRDCFDLSWVEPRHAPREIPEGRLALELPALDPPVRFLWINGSNPAGSLPDCAGVAAALSGVDFKVVADFHWNDTARLADIVLPCTSFLEEGGVVSSYGQPYVQLMRPASARVGEARTDLEMAQALAERLGIGAEMAGTEDEWTDRLLGPRDPDGHVRADLRSRGFCLNPSLAAVPFAAGRFPTRSGRFEFPRSLRVGGWPQPEPGRGLLLITPKPDGYLLSQTEHLDSPPRPAVAVHPGDAGALSAGQRVRVSSAKGSIGTTLVLDETLPRGVAVLPVSGTLARHDAVNILTDAGKEAAGGACPAYFDCPVTIDETNVGVVRNGARC